MSLVHQALRKAEQEKQRKSGIVPPAPARLSPPPAPIVATPLAPVTPPSVVAAPLAPVPPAKSRALWPAVLGCVAFGALAAGVFFATRPETPVPPPRASVPVAETTPPTAASDQPATPFVPDAPASVAVDEARYQLTGIAQEADGRPVAVLNGQPRYEGQYIDGAIVKKIERDRVTLDVKGQTFTKRLF